MKRYLTLCFSILAVLSIIISYQFDVRWNGIVAWGLACIFLSCAAVSIKFIEDK